MINEDFTMDFAEFESSLIPEGFYEVILKAEPVVVKSQEKLCCTFYIRKDVPTQRYGGMSVTDWLKHDDLYPQYYERKRTALLLKSQKDKVDETGKPLYNTRFKNVDELVQFLNGLCLRVHVIQDEYNGVTNNKIEYCTYLPSNVNYRANLRDYIKSNDTNKVVDVKEDDLPF